MKVERAAMREIDPVRSTARASPTRIAPTAA